MDAAQIEQALRRAHAAGDEAGARVLAKAMKAAQPAETTPEASPAPEQSYLGGLARSALQGVTFGFGDELEGVEGAILGKTPDGGMFDYSKPFGERYTQNAEAYRGKVEGFRESNPVSAIASELVGGLGTGVGAGRAGVTLMRGGRGVGQTLARGAAEGAAYGGLYGAGNADDGGRAAGAAMGAGVGAATGGASTAILGALSRGAANNAAVSAAPSLDDLKLAENAAWRAADARNPLIPGAQGFAQQARQVLSQEGFDALSHPKVARALDILDDRIAQNPQQAWKEVNAFRRHVSEEIVNGGGAVSNGERRLGKMLRGALDNWVETTSPVPEAVAARELTGRVKRSEYLNKALYQAENTTAATGSGGNINNEMLKKLRTVLNNDKLRAKFTPDDIAIMEKTLRDTQKLGPRALRLAGKLSPAGNGLMTALGLGATAINPAMVAAPAIGMVAKALSDRGTANAIGRIEAGVRAGRQFPTQTQLSPAAKAVIRALSGQAGGATP